MLYAGLGAEKILCPANAPLSAAPAVKKETTDRCGWQENVGFSEAIANSKKP
jgi:hypothetical protein